MPTLAALPDAASGATLREVAIQAVAPRSLRHLRIRVDDLARRALSELQAALPTETAAGVLRRLGLPTTTRSIAVMREFGFAYEPTDLDSQVRWRIHAALVAGVWCPQVIADEVGCTVAQVRDVAAGGKYDTDARSSEVSNGSGVVLRRVNIVGQMTYRRVRYSVGRAYRGRVARVREDGDHLDVTFGDRPAVRIPRIPHA